MNLKNNIKKKYKKWIGIIITTLIWGFLFNFFDKRDDNSVYTWLFFVYFSIMTGYVIGRNQVIKQLFEKGEVNELSREYDEMHR